MKVLGCDASHLSSQHKSCKGIPRKQRIADKWGKGELMHTSAAVVACGQALNGRAVLKSHRLRVRWLSLMAMWTTLNAGKLGLCELPALGSSRAC